MQILWCGWQLITIHEHHHRQDINCGLFIEVLHLMGAKFNDKVKMVLELLSKYLIIDFESSDLVFILSAAGASEVIYLASYHPQTEMSLSSLLSFGSCLLNILGIIASSCNISLH